MNEWYDARRDEWHEYEAPDLTLHVSENPVVAELLDADGGVLRQWRERPPFGFRSAQ